MTGKYLPCLQLMNQVEESENLNEMRKVSVPAVRRRRVVVAGACRLFCVLLNYQFLFDVDLGRKFASYDVSVADSRRRRFCVDGFRRFCLWRAYDYARCGVLTSPSVTWYPSGERVHLLLAIRELRRTSCTIIMLINSWSVRHFSSFKDAGFFKSSGSMSEETPNIFCSGFSVPFISFFI